MTKELKLLIKSLNSKQEIEELLKKLQNHTFYELTFTNVKMLPSEIIIRLHEIQEQLSLNVTDKKLRFYLRNLGFRIEYKEKLYNTTLKKIDNINYLALGGSAGSLKKFMEIVAALPPSDITIFIVMHQRADVKSSLASILQNKTSHYKVVEATSDIRVMPSTIYIAPSDKHMVVLGGFIFLTDDALQHFSRPSISITFKSLAEEYREQLLTILVCGYGADGSDSLKAIRDNGGMVIIEQLYECEATPMLENAIHTKEFDHILSISDINRLLEERLTQDTILKKHLLHFLKKINKKYGYDYTHYSQEHIKRRIEHFYKSSKFRNFLSFEESILENSQLFKDLSLDISINITTLFRNPQTYKLLRELIQKKFQHRHSLKIWCAGCSSGEEPYSVAIMLKELGLLNKSLIYATDINSVILEQAKNGIYSKKSFELFKEHYVKSGAIAQLEYYFTDYKTFVKVDKKIQNKILFFRHNLVSDAPLNEFQLVLCRNVIIYFDNQLKQRVFKLFDASLEKSGVLVLGESETYDDRKNFITLDKENRLYEKCEDSTC